MHPVRVNAPLFGRPPILRPHRPGRLGSKWLAPGETSVASGQFRKSPGWLQAAGGPQVPCRAKARFARVEKPAEARL